MSLHIEPGHVSAALPVSRALDLLSVRSLSKRFGANQVLTDFTLDVSEGEFLTILGESGSGKTTLLRLVAGFESPDAGEIWMHGDRLDGLPPYRRRVNTVFQQYALFPHYSVFENVAYGLRIARAPREEVTKRVGDALAMVKMTDFARAQPAKLSGGQQQRIALARALVNRPRLLLLDEPLSALDANLRTQMQMELKSLQREVGITFIFVTHDQHEALAMSDRIALMRHGRLEQVAPPRDIYLRPASTYVASFIGRSNILKCSVENHIASCTPLQFRTDVAGPSQCFSLRPEAIRMVNAAENREDLVRFRARIIDYAFQGAADSVTLECASGLRLVARISASFAPSGEHDFAFSPSDAVAVRESES